MVSQLDESRIHRVEVAIDMCPTDIPGRILDIGGGGEGIIGQIFGERVVAIDRLKQELVGAPAGPLKIIMDARDLQFLDDTFDAATAFFSFMFMDREDLPRVFSEIARVLKPGATLTIWDAVIPPRGDDQRDVFVVRLNITLPTRTVRTGYGAFWDKSRQNVETFVELGEQAGFEVSERTEQGHALRVVLRRSPA